MEWSWLLWLLPVASFSGYLLGKRSNDKLNGEKVEGLSKQYFIGLNHLLNEEADQALAMFESIADHSVDRFETQLALGNLFRRRGELERAIRLHQSLAIKPQLTTEQRCIALLELGDDFVRAGLLDRAEALFEELLQMDTESIQALKQLQKIYEQEQDWRKAIDAAEKRQALSGENLGSEIAHFYCEAALKLEPDQQDPLFEKAEQADPNSVRAQLLITARLLDKQNLEGAKIRLQGLLDNDPIFIPEVVPLILRLASSDTKGAEMLLQSAIKIERGVSALLAYVSMLGSTHREQALSLMRERMQTPGKSSLRVMQAWLSLQNDPPSSSACDDDQRMVLSVLKELDKKSLSHRCGYCGFGTLQQHWLCPSCRNWGTTKPIAVL